MPTTSKVSFDTLSDPHPPTPGDGQRAAVSARAGTLARRRRLMQGAGALACTVVLGLGVVAVVSSSGSSPDAKVETASAPEPGTKAITPTVAPTVAPAVAPVEDESANPTPAPESAAPAAVEAPAAESAPAAAALASANASVNGVPDDVTLNVTLVGANGTFSSSVRTPAAVTFSDVPPGDYEVRWEWSSDDGTATAVGRGNVTLAGGTNSFTV
jgi:hypothetical protein